MTDVTKQNEAKSLEVQNNQLIGYSELAQMVTSFQDQLQSLDYRVTNKNFGSKIYQTKETINSKSRFVAGAKDDIAVLDAQHPTYRLWIGAEDPTTAPFRVDKAGNATMSSVTLSGYLQIGEALTDIGTGNITSTYLGTNSVTTDKILANAVTATKISVSSLSAISANIGTVTAGTITGITITGGTVQTDSSGLRTVLGDGTDSIKFMNGSTVYGSIAPYVFASGNGIHCETLAGDAYWYLQEGTQDQAGIAIGNGDGIFIATNDISIVGDATFADDVTINRTLSITLGMGSNIDMNNYDLTAVGAISMAGHIDMNGYDITAMDDITGNTFNADIIQLSGGGYVDNARAFYFETGRSTHVSVSGEMRYYDGTSKYFECYVNGFRGSIDLTAT